MADRHALPVCDGEAGLVDGNPLDAMLEPGGILPHASDAESPLMPIAPWELVLALAITALASTLHGALGFGFGLLCVPILAMVDPVLAPVPQLLLLLPMTFSIAWSNRADADLSHVPWVTLGRLPGAALGLFLLAVVSEDALGIAIAVMVLIAVALLAGGRSIPRNPFTSFAAGVTSGVMGLVASIGGPPLAMLYRGSSGPTLRASLSVVFAIGVVISISARALAGEVLADEIVVALMLMPAMAGGLVVGKRLAPRVDGAPLRTAILVVSAAAAIALLAQSVF